MRLHHLKRSILPVLFSLVVTSFSFAQKGGDRGFTPDNGNTASTQKRIALVIGNSAYAHVTPLPNPVNDADDMAATLKSLGFDKVILKKNLGRADFDKTIREFGNEIVNYNAALFFYAGHGLEIGENYLVPVDVPADMKIEDFRNDCINLDWIRTKMNNSKGLNKDNIVILDACRNNPFRSFRGDTEVWGASKIQCQSLITCYSTSSSEKAADGAGRNSPFTTLLIRHMKEPGIEIRELFRRVRLDLLNEYKQLATSDDSYLNQFYFVPPIENSTDDHNPNSLRDSDGDGIIDEMDRCPYIFGPISNNGCPESSLSEVQTEVDKAFSLYKNESYSAAYKIFNKYKDMDTSGRSYFYIGELYYYGRHVSKDLSEAVKCYRKSADLGFNKAQNNMGFMYRNGYGVPKSDEEGAKWYRVAAEQGFAVSQYNLGIIYRNGYGVPQDDEEAVKWYRKAAVQGHENSQNNLGFMYENGYGVQKDLSEALKWYQKACDNGNDTSCKKVEQLKN